MMLEIKGLILTDLNVCRALLSPLPLGHGKQKKKLKSNQFKTTIFIFFSFHGLISA